MPAPFADKEFTFRNPDGSQIRLRGTGNQFVAVFETPDGYTVVRHPETGYYNYARLSADGSSLVPTDARVGEVDPATLGVPRHLRVSAAAAKRAARAALEARPRRPRWETRRAEQEARRAELRRAGGDEELLAVSGGITGLCLLIEFPERPATVSREEVDNFCNQRGYNGNGNNGSVRDYFLDVSGGRLDYTNVVTAYYTAQHNFDFYNYDPTSEGAYGVIKEALTSLREQGFDFSGLSADDAGYIYALNVFYAGDAPPTWGDPMWPHFSSIPPFEATPTTRFSDYQITNIGGALTLGTFCHENGHMVCGLPDLYDYGYESNGAGGYCLMAFGGGGTNPVHPCAFLKNMAGWTDRLTELNADTTYSVDAGRNDFLLYRRNDQEYFILENRTQTGRDANLPDAGLFIWHVDEWGSNDNEQMTPTLHYKCSLEQADGAFHLEHRVNYGDDGDVFGAPSETSFSDYTTPDSRWWDTSPSGLRIEEISAPASTMTLAVRGGWHAAAVSAVADRSDIVYVFAVDEVGATYLTSRGDQGSWSPWEANWNKAPKLRAVTATGDRSNSLYVFGLADDGVVYGTYRDATGAWGSWERDWKGAPRLRTLVPMGDLSNRLYVFGLAADGTTYRTERDAQGAWGTWQANWNRAPKLRTITAMADLVGNVYVFGTTADEAVYMTSRDTRGAWTAWKKWSDAPKLHAIAVAHDRTSQIYAFGLASDGTVYLATRDNTGAWSSWDPDWNGAPKLHAVAPVGDTANAVYAFGVTPEETVVRTSRDANGAWTPWQEHLAGAPALAMVVPVENGDNTLHVLGATPAGRIYVSTRDPQGSWTDWTALN
ncbi:MAG TPA: M6 family metalloprotease domain-containing protein [Streptosporangiaceae bacterium]|nr:M6 family metalloprotease domain-containing protein [Streptosporangiaceae bacterium]